MRDRERRSYLLNIYRPIRNVFAAIGGICLTLIAMVADSESPWNFMFGCMAVACISFIIAAIIEKYMIDTLLQDDLVLDTIFTWSMFKSNLNISPYNHYLYRRFLKTNGLADTEDNFEYWLEH